MNQVINYVKEERLFDYHCIHWFDRSPLAAELSKKFRKVSIIVDFGRQELSVTGEYIAAIERKPLWKKFSFLWKIGDPVKNVDGVVETLDYISAEGVMICDKHIGYAQFINNNCKLNYQ